MTKEAEGAFPIQKEEKSSKARRRGDVKHWGASRSQRTMLATSMAGQRGFQQGCLSTAGASSRTAGSLQAAGGQSTHSVFAVLSCDICAKYLKLTEQSSLLPALVFGVQSFKI